MAATDPFFASGTGNAAEALMDVNPTVTIPARGVFQIWNFLATFSGAGYIRLRETDINGAELLRIRFSADGLIQGDFRTAPLQYKAGATARTLVLTQEGAFANSILISGGP